MLKWLGGGLIQIDMSTYKLAADWRISLDDSFRLRQPITSQTSHMFNFQIFWADTQATILIKWGKKLQFNPVSSLIVVFFTSLYMRVNQDRTFIFGLTCALITFDLWLIWVDGQDCVIGFQQNTQTAVRFTPSRSWGRLRFSRLTPSVSWRCGTSDSRVTVLHKFSLCTIHSH